MSKTCWFCKNTEDFFLNQKKDLLNNIEDQIKQCENFSTNIIETTKEKFGFSDEQKKKVKAIKTVYSEMTFNAVFENRSNFLQLEPNLLIIFEYFDKFYKINANFKTVKDVIDMFLQEPVENRYSIELRNNERKLSQLKEQKNKLEKITTFFIEKKITADSIDNIKNRLKKTGEESYKDFSLTSFIRRQPKQEEDFDFSFRNLGFNIDRRIYICPICLTIFAEASLASFEIKNAQRKAMESALDEDWGDEDDF